MTLKRNIAANYVSQIYIVGVSIITLPVLLKYMGAEAYGLIGFFSMLQACLLLLDLGMSPTLSREIARYRGGALDEQSLMMLIKVLRLIFISLALVCVVSTVVFSYTIAVKWLNLETLSISSVRFSIMLMGGNIGCRLVSSVLKAAVTGFERLVWLSVYNAIFNTLRFVIVFAAFYVFGTTVEVFFIYQLLIAIIEVTTIWIFTHKLFPHHTTKLSWLNIKALKPLMGFSLTIAFTSSVWILITQTDKLILSKLLPLSEFGFYAMAIQIAAGITLAAGPISSAILPRLARLEAENNQEGFKSLYHKSTQLVVVIAGSLGLMLVFFAPQILFAWSGDIELSRKVAPYLILYAIGNVLLSVAAFPYYLQYAKGNLKYHLYGNIGFVVLLVPALVLIVKQFGGIGAGYVWIGVNALYLFGWIPFIHNRFFSNFNKQWYLNSIVKVLAPMLIVTYFCSIIPLSSDNRLVIIFVYGLAGILIFTIGVFSSSFKSDIKNWVMSTFNKVK